MAKRKKVSKTFHKNTARQAIGPVKAKKYLGQHFLKDEAIAQRIAGTLVLEGYNKVIEVGAGTGVLSHGSRS